MYIEDVAGDGLTHAWGGTVGEGGAHNSVTHTCPLGLRAGPLGAWHACKQSVADGVSTPPWPLGGHTVPT
jgi:hypothetical protein